MYRYHVTYQGITRYSETVHADSIYHAARALARGDVDRLGDDKNGTHYYRDTDTNATIAVSATREN